MIFAVMQPLDPSCAGRLASCCRGLRERLREPLAALRTENRSIRSLCAKAGTTCAAMREAKRLVWSQRDLNDEDAVTLASLAYSGQLERVKFLGLPQNRLSDCGAEALATALRAGGMRRLQVLDLSSNRIEAQGRRALGLALEAPGALLSLVSINLANNTRTASSGASSLQLDAQLREALLRQFAHARSRKRLVSAKGLVAER